MVARSGLRWVRTISAAHRKHLKVALNTIKKRGVTGCTPLSVVHSFPTAFPLTLFATASGSPQRSERLRKRVIGLSGSKALHQARRVSFLRSKRRMSSSCCCEDLVSVPRSRLKRGHLRAESPLRAGERKFLSCAACAAALPTAVHPPPLKKL